MQTVGGEITELTINAENMKSLMDFLCDHFSCANPAPAQLLIRYRQYGGLLNSIIELNNIAIQKLSKLDDICSEYSNVNVDECIDNYSPKGVLL